MKSAHFLLVAVVVLLLALPVTPAAATIVTLSDPDNVAPLATLSTSGGQRLDAVRDLKLDNGSWPSDWDDTSHFIGNKKVTWVDLSWASPQQLNSLQAYIIAEIAENEGGIDRQTLSVEFFVDQGSGLTSVGGVAPTVDTDDIGNFDLTKVDGYWANVTKARYQFVGLNDGQGSRVGEVLALQVPEPSTLVLLGTGIMAGLLACASRGRRREAEG